MSTADHLPAASLAFLADLAAHNDRDWFDTNRARSKADLIEPCMALVRGILVELDGSFPHITGSDKGNGGSLTRLHRDTRFSKDKRPYNAHIGLHFWHAAGKKMVVPGFFLRVDPDEVLVATGWHGPDKPELETIRDAIAADAAGWSTAAHGAAFRKAWGGLEGESLKRVPKPWPADHALGDDLRRKDFTAFARWKSSSATRKGFASRVAEQWQASEPLMAFLCRAGGLDW